jgi:phosphoserine phosphatase
VVVTNEHKLIVFPHIENRDVVFDLDGTLLEGDLGETVFFRMLLQQEDYCDASRDPFLEQNGQVHCIAKGNRAQELTHYQNLLARGHREEAYIFTARVLNRYPKDHIRAIAEQILLAENVPIQMSCLMELGGETQRESVLQYGARIRHEMTQLVGRLLENSARLWIVSASPQAVAEGCGDLLQFSRTNVLATIVSQGENKPSRFPWKAAKRAALRKAGVLQPAIVFGNGVEDCEMLDSAKMSVVMADGNSELLDIARQRDWYILGPSTRVKFRS